MKKIFILFMVIIMIIGLAYAQHETNNKEIIMHNEKYPETEKEAIELIDQYKLDKNLEGLERFSSKIESLYLSVDTNMYININSYICMALRTTSFGSEEKIYKRVYQLLRNNVKELMTLEKSLPLYHYINSISSLHTVDELYPSESFGRKKSAKHCLYALKRLYVKYEPYRKISSNVITTSSMIDITMSEDGKWETRGQSKEELEKEKLLNDSLKIHHEFTMYEESLIETVSSYMTLLYSNEQDKVELMELMEIYIPKEKKLKRVLLGEEKF